MTNQGKYPNRYFNFVKTEKQPQFFFGYFTAKIDKFKKT